MSQQEQIEDIAAFNENSLQELSWAIASSTGEFSLLLAHCILPYFPVFILKN